MSLGRQAPQRQVVGVELGLNVGDLGRVGRDAREQLQALADQPRPLECDRLEDLTCAIEHIAI